MNYHIKPGYRINPMPRPVVHDPGRTERYQEDVYRLAARVAGERKLVSVLDVGCGLGDKLVDWLGAICPDLTGIDEAGAIDHCRRTHDRGQWLVMDAAAGAPLGRRFDMVMAIDVIEHVPDPDTLLRFVHGHVRPGGVVVLSTPERDLRRGTEDMGPPANTAHVREWNGAEFRSYLDHSQLLRILDHQVVEMLPGIRTCQVVVAEPLRL